MSNRENTQEYSKDMLRIQIVDSNGKPIPNAEVVLLAMGQKVGQKIALPDKTNFQGETLFNIQEHIKNINRFEITINHPDYYSYPINRNRKICRSYEYGHLCVESFAKIPTFYFNGKTLNMSHYSNPTKTYALKTLLNQDSNNQAQKEYYIQLQENSTSLKIYTDENLTKESEYALSLETATQTKSNQIQHTQQIRQTQDLQTESTLSQSNTTMILNFDSKESLEQFTKDIQEIIIKDKKKGYTKLVHRFVVREEKIQIFNKEGIYLFSIERKDRTETRLSVSGLYKLQGIQWFESSAEKYHKLLDVNPDLKDKEKCQKLGVLYFTWRDIVEFAEVDRFSSSFRSGGSGDWKQLPKGARGFILVSMEGIPYWADAVGQIPYAIGVYRNSLEAPFAEQKDAEEAVIVNKYAFYDGNLPKGTLRKLGILSIPKDELADNYDNKMVDRGLNFAIQKYIKKKTKSLPTHDEYEIIDLQPNPCLLALDSNNKVIYE